MIYAVVNPDTQEVYAEQESEVVAQAIAEDLGAIVVPLEEE